MVLIDEESANSTGDYPQEFTNKSAQEFILDDIERCPNEALFGNSACSKATDAIELTLEQQRIKDAGYSMEDVLDPPPDGGWGWVCVGCALAISFSCWGTNMCFGVFLNYYLESDYFPNATKYDFALVGSLVPFLAQLLSPFIFLSVESIGLKPTLCIGVLFIFLGNLLASFAKLIWQLYLCQGFLAGVSFAFLYYASITIIPRWFLLKRALAIGIILTGTGLGGLVFSLAVNAMIKKTGNHKWALRMLAIVCLFVSSTAVIFIRERRPQKLEFNWPKIRQRLKIICDPKIVKESSVIYITLWFAISNLGFYQLVFSLSAFATSIGLTSSQGSNIIVIMNLSQVVGRPFIGLYADKFGRVNFALFGTAYLGIIVLCYWVNVNSYGALAGLAVASGLLLGTTYTMVQPITADSVPPIKFPALFSFVSICAAPVVLTAEVIALALRDENSSKPFLHSQLLGGISLCLAFAVLLPVREIKIKRMMEARLDTAQTRIREEQDAEVKLHLQEKILSYDQLLERRKRNYWRRLFYPIRA